MMTRSSGRLLIGLGVAVGVVTGLAITLGWSPSGLPAPLSDISGYKLAFFAALGLIAAGAIIVRQGRQP